MKRKIRMTIGSAALAGTILLLTAAGAQQRGAKRFFRERL